MEHLVTEPFEPKKKVQKVKVRHPLYLVSINSFFPEIISFYNFYKMTLIRTINLKRVFLFECTLITRFRGFQLR